MEWHHSLWMAFWLPDSKQSKWPLWQLFLDKRSLNSKMRLLSFWILSLKKMFANSKDFVISDTVCLSRRSCIVLYPSRCMIFVSVSTWMKIAQTFRNTCSQTFPNASVIFTFIRFFIEMYSYPKHQRPKILLWTPGIQRVSFEDPSWIAKYRG